MKRITTVLALAAALPAISACGQQSDGDNMAAQANQQETAGQDAMMDDPSNPFAEAEMQMHDRMMAAGAADVSEAWARKMIAHHQGAIDMSQILIDQGGDPEMVSVARRTIEMQRGEIGELERLLAGGTAAADDGRAPSNAAAATSAAAPAALPKAPAATEPRPPRPEPAPNPEQPQPDPYAGHDMNDMQ